MSRSELAKTAIALGMALLLLAAVLFTNGHFCFFNKASCGMVEPLLALPALILGLVAILAGVLGIRHIR